MDHCASDGVQSASMDQAVRRSASALKGIVVTQSQETALKNVLLGTLESFVIKCVHLERTVTTVSNDVSVRNQDNRKHATM
ncbi:hypothetical protein ANCCAN_27797 [Ancylostoma caninum]|uniref:Uncharacterized protein n=1 Tax=Ancylostoma caninum TaxID=29170 RepID=A0A368F307_ANCCA|nr:hypothetical protein ANCCAN_27797 [Ancylostoma caninum]